MSALTEQPAQPLGARTGTGRHGAQRRHRLRDFATGKAGAGVRHDLEGLRALAVLGVVVFHLRASWLPGGFAGVDVFFVLSGYFITGLLLREIERTGTVALMRFWGRRARRLLPASALVVTVTVVAAWRLTNALEAQRVARDGLYAAVFGMNWHAAWQGTQYLQDPHPSPLVHYWSLGVEEQFYLAWPLLLAALALMWTCARRRRWADPRRTLLVVALVVGSCSFLLALEQTGPANSFAYFGTPERVWQLALGGALAALGSSLGRLPTWARAAARYAGVALIVAFYVGADVDILYPGRKSLIPAFGAALVIIAGEPVWRRRDPLARVLCSAVGQLGGRYSYSWYLWHYPPLVIVPIWLDRPLRIRELGLVAVGTLLAAVLTYHLLEDPIRSNRWLAARRSGRSLLLGAALVAVMAAGAWGIGTAARHQAHSTGIVDAAGKLLVPQPAAAAADFPQIYADKCGASLTDPNSALPAGDAAAPGCRYLPDTGKGDVVLTGDSHAAMWFPAVYTMAKQKGWGLQVWQRNSCPFADVTKDIGHPYVVCDEFRHNVLAAIVRMRPTLVVTANIDTAFSPLYARDARGRPTHEVRGVASHRLFEDGYVHSLQTLRRAGIPVLVIHDNPGYPVGMKGPDCVLTHPNDLDACSLPQSQVRPDGPGDLGAARRVSGVSTVDYTQVFCPHARCHQVIGNVLAYRDENHLTTPMVQLLRPGLTAAATATMAGRVVHERVTSSQLH